MKIHIDETESTVNFLSSTENGLNLVLNYTLSKDSNGEATVLYKVFDVKRIGRLKMWHVVAMTVRLRVYGFKVTNCSSHPYFGFPERSGNSKL